MASVRPSAAAAPRPMRADAQRNREAILAAARDTFEEEGVLASLDGIALRAGVGNATLYRNFPTRADLLAAVMVDKIAGMLALAGKLAGTLDAREALAEWLFQLTWALRIWHDLPYCIASAQCDPASSINAASAQMLAETGRLLERAREAGMASSAVTAAELFELATILSWGVDRYGDDEAAARRRVAMAIAGVFQVPA